MPKKWKKDRKKYFGKEQSVGVNPKAWARLQSALARVRETNLKILDQETLSQETFLNATWLYIHGLIEQHGIGWIEKQMRPAFDELARLVGEEMKAREAIEREKGRAEGEGPPEGISGPGKKAPNGPAPTRRRQRKESAE